MKSIAKILGLAGVLLLGSCSKEDSSPLTSSVQSSTASGVYFSGSIGLDEARSLSHTIVKGSAGSQEASSTPTDHQWGGGHIERYKPRASFSGSRSEILFVLKSDNASQPVSYVKVPVTHKDDRSFDIDGSVNVTLAPGTNLSVGNWYALGFVYSSGKSSGQTVSFNEATKRLEITAPSGGTYTASEFDASTETGNTLTAPSVYMFDWMPLQIVTSGGRSTVKLTSRAQLKPQGALFLLEVSNLDMRRWGTDEEIYRRYKGAIEQHHGSRVPIWIDLNGAPVYDYLSSMDVDFDRDATGLPAASLDGYYDLSASALDFTQSPKLKMGVTHKMRIHYPQYKYYYTERFEDKPMFWSAVWMAPNAESGTDNCRSYFFINASDDAHTDWSTNHPAFHEAAIVPWGGQHFFGRDTYFNMKGLPRNGNVIYRQVSFSFAIDAGY